MRKGVKGRGHRGTAGSPKIELFLCFSAERHKIFNQ